MEALTVDRPTCRRWKGRWRAGEDEVPRDHGRRRRQPLERAECFRKLARIRRRTDDVETHNVTARSVLEEIPQHDAAADGNRREVDDEIA